MNLQLACQIVIEHDLYCFFTGFRLRPATATFSKGSCYGTLRRETKLRVTDDIIRCGPRKIPPFALRNPVTVTVLVSVFPPVPRWPQLTSPLLPSRTCLFLRPCIPVVPYRPCTNYSSR